MNLKTLQNKLLGEQLSRRQEKCLVRMAEKPTNEEELYTALGALGRTGNVKYRPYLEAAMRSSNDPTVLNAALRGLVRHMGLVSEWRDSILLYCRGIETDIGWELRLSAVQLAADVFEQGYDADLLLELMFISKDPNVTQTIREDAYEVAASAVKQYRSQKAELTNNDRSVLNQVEAALCFPSP
jgi:hypothetical protein